MLQAVGGVALHAAARFTARVEVHVAVRERSACCGACALKLIFDV